MPVSLYLAFPPVPRKTTVVYFCCTFPGVSSGGRYPLSCPAEPGLSSCQYLTAPWHAAVPLTYGDSIPQKRAFVKILRAKRTPRQQHIKKQNSENTPKKSPSRGRGTACGGRSHGLEIENIVRLVSDSTLRYHGIVRELYRKLPLVRL